MPYIQIEEAGINWRWGITVMNDKVHILPGASPRSFCGLENLPEAEDISDDAELCLDCVDILMSMLDIDEDRCAELGLEFEFGEGDEDKEEDENEENEEK